MEKCQICQYYDRQNVKSHDGQATQWGQCRRQAPMLHPVNVKSFMIEGVWPHVRDDDWCGEWKLLARRSDVRVTEVSPVTHVEQVSRVTPTPIPPPRVGPLAMPTSIGSAPALMPLPGVAMVASGRGD